MYSLLKTILFLLPPEKAHYLAMNLLQFGLRLPILGQFIKIAFKPKNQLPVNFCGIKFPNKVGLAAGFDKDARWLHALQYLGFGHVEIGTLTPLPQQGNPKPRLFRLKKDQSLINRMGFNNQGIDKAILRLTKRPKNLIVGGNIGKNKLTPNSEAINDYEICFTKIYPYVDYIVVNVSSPNTPGLRELQDSNFLKELFIRLQSIRLKHEAQKPILLKIAPDITMEVASEIASVVMTHKVDGLIISNTTIDRDQLMTDGAKIEEIGAGGLSGQAIFKKSTQVLEMMKNQLPDNYPIIGVGGVKDSSTALAKIKAGAQLVQLYTSFIYEGPSVVKKILQK